VRRPIELARRSDSRVPALDGIRGLAILLVIPHNGNMMPAGPVHGVAQMAKELMLNGWTGVQLFFVLSGFLISGVLLDAQDSSNYYKSFYARRALRILPLYYGMLVVTFLVLAPMGLLPAETLASQHNQVWLWTFLSNWTDPLGFEVKGFAHFWSLAVEEQFYLVWPFILHRMRPQRVVVMSLSICLAALALRTLIRIEAWSDAYPYEFTVCRMDALAMGAGAAALIRIPHWRQRITRTLPYLPWTALGLLLGVAPLTHDYARTVWATQTFGLTTLAAAFTFLVAAASFMRTTDTTWAARFLCLGPLRAAGKYSYAMYLFHFPLHKLLGVRLLGVTESLASPGAAILYVVALTAVTFVAGWGSYHLYEKHFLRLKRFFPTHAAALGAA
jgi:peptidoglycan/LPS O-acetylase OafA/YrhL